MNCGAPLYWGGLKPDKSIWTVCQGHLLPLTWACSDKDATKSTVDSPRWLSKAYMQLIHSSDLSAYRQGPKTTSQPINALKHSRDREQTEPSVLFLKTKVALEFVLMQYSVVFMLHQSFRSSSAQTVWLCCLFTYSFHSTCVLWGMLKLRLSKCLSF